MSPKNPIARECVTWAQKAQEKGDHYAGFKVGAIGYVSGEIVGTESQQILMMEGANTKPSPDVLKDCAEMKIMRQADEAGLVIDGFVVVGKPRKEDKTPTLHPCEACRKLMRAYLRANKVVRSSTHITCVNSTDSFVEEFTVESLHLAHGELLSDD